MTAGNATGTISIFNNGIRRQLCHYLGTSGHNHHVSISPTANTPRHQSHSVKRMRANSPDTQLQKYTFKTVSAVFLQNCWHYIAIYKAGLPKSCLRHGSREGRKGVSHSPAEVQALLQACESHIGKRSMQKRKIKDYSQGALHFEFIINQKCKRKCGVKISSNKVSTPHLAIC
ncbi:hypothetical protein PO909_032195 [Leuciscus waleckii]